MIVTFSDEASRINNLREKYKASCRELEKTPNDAKKADRQSRLWREFRSAMDNKFLSKKKEVVSCQKSK